MGDIESVHLSPIISSSQLFLPQCLPGWLQLMQKHLWLNFIKLKNVN